MADPNAPLPGSQQGTLANNTLLELLNRMVVAQENQADRLADMQEKQAAQFDRLADRLADMQEKQAERDAKILHSLEALNAASSRRARRLEKQPEHLKFSLPHGSDRPESPRDYSSVKSTPSRPPLRSERYDTQHYRKLYTTHKDKFGPQGLANLLSLISPALAQEWVKLCSTDEDKEHIQLVFTSYREAMAKIADKGGFSLSDREKGAEKYYQCMVDALVTAVQDTSELGNRLPIRWFSSFESPMQGKRKPDGIFVEASAGISSKDWHSVIAAMEIKGSTGSESVLRGQLIQDFLDMSRDQARKLAIGLGVSGKLMVSMYLCDFREIMYSHLGILPSEDNTSPDNANIAVIRALRLFYSHLDPTYGYLIPQRGGIIPGFSISNALYGGYVRFDKSNYADRTLNIDKLRSFSGRRDRLGAARSWLFRVNFPSLEAGKGLEEHLILKVNQDILSEREGEVHQRVLDMNVPYVPGLLVAAYPDKTSQYSHWEILLIEDAGMPIRKYLAWENALHACNLVDIFAGYSHTLLAANAGSGGAF
ncbi:hypothetical protein IWW36_004704, partial [Coemansia brasiliensis]